ncbi:MAG TPA: rod shape-determining protein RodA [Spirochaetota bacterium]|nr:rod shape-determining protein RodA [Spirochaetota bacterium]HOM87683.1 rod shape-determining protein RodA [Spirochaetota bacterium]HOT19049.1 rod shape-determining protein RodA [Spirochaetota bacterium]HPD04682.1 rod shape-determining protein RodA [Spirochaetota bacterium]HQG41289.1 rod shape-determining protein RodA [Spirochaetota bacterium]
MFKTIRSSFQEYDIKLLISIIALILIGIITIYATGFDPIEKVNSGLYKKQLLWFIIGIICMFAISRVHYRILGDYSLYIYLVVLFFLIITTIFGAKIRNTRAWINFGFFAIQPSEFMKLATILLLSKYLELRQFDIKRLRELFIPFAIVGVPVLLIYMQPDFGTAMIFIPIFFALLFLGGADILQLISILGVATIALFVPMMLTYIEWSGINISGGFFSFLKGNELLYIISGSLLAVSIISFILYFFFNSKVYRAIYIPSFIISAGLFLSVIIQKFLKEYQKRRILVFLNPDLDPYGSGYNVIQSKIAIGSGGIIGKGFLKGSQSQLGFLPEKSTDFIFSVISEEWGFIGAVIVLLLFGYILYKGCMIALKTSDKFGMLLAGGITCMIFFHVFINIGMALGIMPVTGLPLTFLSYGGSNLIMSLLSIGILINIDSRTR